MAKRRKLDVPAPLELELLHEMAAALQRILDLDASGVADFFVALQRHEACIAGSFPLWFCTQPQRQTQWRVVEARLAALPLPQPALERVADYVRAADHLEYAKTMDVDIFSCNELTPRSLRPVRLGRRRDDQSVRAEQSGAALCRRVRAERARRRSAAAALLSHSPRDQARRAADRATAPRARGTMTRSLRSATRWQTQKRCCAL